VKDRDFLETKEGYFFCVIGYQHPPDRVISYLKYAPGEVGKAAKIRWFRGETQYGRVMPSYNAMGFAEVINYLSLKEPRYIYFDRVFGTPLIGVPKSEVKVHYLPEARLHEITLMGERDALMELLMELVGVLSREANVSRDKFGVLGSILLGIHDVKESDVDLVVYGSKNVVKVKEAIASLLNDPRSDLRRPKGRLLRKWALDVIANHPLAIDEALKVYQEKLMATRMLFKGRQFSIHAGKLDEEIIEEYGSKIFRPVSMITVKAKVLDHGESYYLPCTYPVGDVEIVEGPKVDGIKEVTSFEGLYSALVEEGDCITVHGMLEVVEDLIVNERYHRILIGSMRAEGRDFLKPLRWRR
jgi:hypothetical protein